MSTLEKTLRNNLNSAVLAAREIAESAAEKSISMLAVAETKPYEHMTDEEKSFRRKLRAHGRELGDVRNSDGTQEVFLLVEESAYEHWHCMLFSRFLAENNLLIHPEMKVPVSLSECEDLAREEGYENRWACAVNYASKMLPMIFRAGSPALMLKYGAADTQALENIIESLDISVFHASDAIGWCYQFWQEKRKKVINDSEVKIGERELAPVTQLFTEPYMVAFLLDNSVGAWYAGKILTAEDYKKATSEEELRNKASLPGVPLKYLRFIKNNNMWQIAAGKFEKWPDNLNDFTMLDPCCGSGHFLVAAFNMLVAIRMKLEDLDVTTAENLVIKQNIHGLELDGRCVEMAAFALAFAAWTYPESNGWRELPKINVACCGKTIRTNRDEWMRLIKKQTDDTNKRLILENLFDVFKDAPALGSLINPAAIKEKMGIFASWKEVWNIFTDLMASADEDNQEIGISASGLADSAEILSNSYSLILTNPPYRKLGDLSEKMFEFFTHNYDDAKRDIATVFIKRCLELCHSKMGTLCCVVPQNWMFLKSYQKLREDLLSNYSFNFIAQLGENGFDSNAAAGAFTILLGLTNITPDNNSFIGIDATAADNPDDKSDLLARHKFEDISQESILYNPDFRITLSQVDNSVLLSNYAKCVVGLQTGDDPRYILQMWEIANKSATWEFFQNTPETTVNIEYYTGYSQVIRWENGIGGLTQTKKSRPYQGQEAFGKECIALVRMRSICPVCYSSSFFHQNLAVVIPKNENDLAAIWSYCESDEYSIAVRKIDQKLNVTNATLVKVPFDIEYWKSEAESRYPNGLPKPFTNNPTQWLFHGHPCKTVVWDVNLKKTVVGKYRYDKSALQVAVCRLLGYVWPAEKNKDMRLDDYQREIANTVGNELGQFVDTDGIVCIPQISSENSAADRLIAILVASYGEKWTIDTLGKLLSSAGYSSTDMEGYLRNGFFKDHCKVYANRPFIWQIWDGLNDGFSVLINYHKLDNKLLSKLIYTVLGSWIYSQKEDMAIGIEGAERKLNAAQKLQRKLIDILEGEAPFDIFTRWKDLSHQSIGWNPDINDGVRVNIRPFVVAGVLRDNFNISWNYDRGKDDETSPWFNEFGGERINDKHLTLAEKKAVQGSRNG